MNHTALERQCLRLASFIRAGIILAALGAAVPAHAQLVATETYSVPHFIDGGVQPVFFDLSDQFVTSELQLSRTTLSIDFSKVPDLFDDPPFFSEAGLVLRKLNTSFSVLQEVTLIQLGSFFDGAPGTSFSGVITFDDSAPAYVNANPDVLAPGVFRPVEPLGLFNGTYSPYWELRVVDAGLQNPLLFRSATLTVLATAAVPEPSTYGAACVLLLLGIAWLRRSRPTT